MSGIQKINILEKVKENNAVNKQQVKINIHSIGICAQQSIIKKQNIKTNEVPKSGCKNIKIQGNKTIISGVSRSLKEQIVFFSSTAANEKTVVNFAISEG